MSTILYRVTMSGTEQHQRIVRSELTRDQVGPVLASLWEQVGYDLPKITVERLEREVILPYQINDNPSQPAILVLSPWGTTNLQTQKLNAIKALRILDPRKLGLKEAKDLVEGGGEIFCSWDLTAMVAMFLRDGLAGDHQLYAEVCVRKEDTSDPISDIPVEHRY